MTLRTYQPAFVSGELSPALWARTDITKYATGLKQAVNVFVHPHGGVSNRAGLEFVAEVKTSATQTRLVPFQFDVSQSYILEFGAGYIRFYRNGGLILASGGGPYEVSTPYAAADLAAVVFAEEDDVMYLAHPSYPVMKLSRFADNNWTMATPTFAPSITAPGGVSAAVSYSTSALTGYIAATYKYVVAAVSAATGEESLPSGTVSCVNDLSIDGGKNTVSWGAVTGAAKYVVYKYSNGSFGYIGSTTDLSLDDQNITADTSDGPQTGNNPFSGAGNYPRCVSFIQQRLAFAGPNNNPQAIFMSQTANYENFGFASPAKASDATSFRMRARQMNYVQSMVPARLGLLVLTSSGEWVVSGGQSSDAITPSSIVISNQGYRGSTQLQPIAVGETMLFPQRTGCVIRDLSYEVMQDAWTGKDLTIMARHLFENREITAWAYAQAPYSMIWVVLNDGSLASLTYVKEQEVWAWTRHNSGAGAVFEDVTVITENGQDTPYFIVRRTINGVQRRFIERLHARNFTAIEDAFFVDSGMTYSGPAAAMLSGLSHLEGCAVVALADGNVVRNLTVSSGAVTLPFAASKVQIGLPYTAVLQTLDLDLGSVQGLGTVQGRYKSVSMLTMRVQDTRGLWIGPVDADYGSEKLVEFKQRSSEAWNAAIQMLTGDIDMTPQWDWSKGGNVFVKQFDPLPFTLLSLMPEVVIGQ